MARFIRRADGGCWVEQILIKRDPRECFGANSARAPKARQRPFLALNARHSLRPSFRSTFDSGNLTACLRTGIYSAFSPSQRLPAKGIIAPFETLEPPPTNVRCTPDNHRQLKGDF